MYTNGQIMKCDWCGKESSIGTAYIRKRAKSSLPVLCKACRMKENYEINNKKKSRAGSFRSAFQSKTGKDLKI